VCVQVHDDGTEDSAALKCEVVEAQTLHVLNLRGRQLHDPAHNRHPGRDNPQTRGQSRTKSATGRQPNDLQCLFQADGHLGPRGYQMGKP
jgi:hypothetical protein